MIKRTYFYSGLMIDVEVDEASSFDGTLSTTSLLPDQERAYKELKDHVSDHYSTDGRNIIIKAFNRV